MSIITHNKLLCYNLGGDNMLGMPTILDFKSVCENIDFAKKYGFEFIELNLNLPYVRRFIENNSTIDNSLKYTLHFFDEADFGLYDEVSEAYTKLLNKYLSKCFKYVSQVNIHLNLGPVVTISGVKNYIYNIEYSEYILRLKKNLEKVKNVCDKYNVSLVLENIESNDFIINTIKDLEPYYNFTYDIGHDFTSGNYLNNYFIKNINKFREMHFHDSTKSKCHLAFNSGELDIKNIYNFVKDKIEYIVIEVKSKSDLISSINFLKD